MPIKQKKGIWDFRLIPPTYRLAISEDTNEGVLIGYQALNTKGKETMGKVVYLQRKPNDTEEPVDPSDVYQALTSWLDTRPKNTRDSYLRLARVWSIFLGSEFDRQRAGALWKKATYTQAEEFLSQCSKKKARSGRAEESSPDGKVSPATVAHKAKILKSLYDCLLHKGLVASNPFARSAYERKGAVTGDRSPYERIPDEDIKAIINYRFDKGVEGMRDKALLFLLIGGALRRSEPITLLMRDVVVTPKGTVILKLRQTKAQKVQKLPLAKWVGKVVLAFKKERQREGARDSDHLFVRYLATSKRTPPLSSQFVYRIFCRYRDELGLSESFTPHACRVTAITRLLDQGYSHRDVKKLSRHASVAMVEKYDREREDDDKSTSTELSFE